MKKRIINIQLLNKKLRKIDLGLYALQSEDIVKIIYDTNYLLLINLTKQEIYFGKEFKGFNLTSFSLFENTIEIAKKILEGKYEVVEK